jgi:predicted dehydrogenase
MDPIRYGVVGLGRAGWDIHIHQLRGRADMRIVAVVDPLPQRREEAEKEFGCKSYDSLAPMLSQSDVEVVIVATPSNDHASDTIASLRAGKHVICEKPMAMSLDEADAMITATKAAKKHLIVHHNYRFFPEFLHLKELIESGIIGKVFHIRNTITKFERRNDWQTLKKFGGGLLNNHGVHSLDQILQLVKSPVAKITSDLKQIASLGDVEDHVKALLKFENGVTVDMEISSAENLAMPVPKWIICGSNGTITSNAKETIVRYFNPKDLLPLQVVESAPANRQFGNEEKIPWQEKRMTVEPWPEDAFFNHVYEVIRENKPSRVLPESVRETMRVVELVRSSAA